MGSIAPAYPSLAGRGWIDSGVKRLIETPLSINGSSPNPLACHVGADGTTSALPARTYGSSLPIAGSGADVVPSGAAPYFGSDSAALTFAGGKCYQAVSASYCDVGTLDFVHELIWVHCTGDPLRAVSKGGFANGRDGWEIYVGNGGNKLAVIFEHNTGAYTILSGAAIAIGSVNHAFIFGNRDEGTTDGCQAIVNGSVYGSVNNITAYENLANNTEKLTIGAGASDLSNQWTGGLILYRLWAQADWIQAGATGSAEMLAVAKRHFALLTGTRPLISIASATSLAAGGTTSPAYQERIVSSAQRLFYMGAGAPRFVERADANGRVFRVALVEAGVTNSCLQSQVAGTTWTVVDASVAASNSDTAPDGTVTADTLTASANAGYLRQTFGTITAVQRTYSHWVRRNGAGNVAGKLQIVKTSDTSVIAEQAFTATSAWQRIEVDGTCVLNDTEVRLVIDTSGESLFVWGGQLENEASATSYVPTTTAAVARVADTPHRISGAAHFGLLQGALYFSFLSPTFTPARSHYLWTIYKAGAAATDFISCYIDTSGRVNLASAATGGSAGAVQLAGDKCDNVVRDCCATWSKNRLKLWVRGTSGGWVEASPDTSFDVPADLDRLDFGADNAAANQAGPILVGAEYQLVPYAVLDPLPGPGGFVMV